MKADRRRPSSPTAEAGLPAIIEHVCDRLGEPVPCILGENGARICIAYDICGREGTDCRTAHDNYMNDNNHR